MKAKRICMLGLILFLILGCASCSYELYDETKTKPATTTSQQDYLIALKATGVYTISEETLEKMITDFLNPKSAGRNAVAGKKITGLKKLPISKTRKKISGARTAAIEQEPVDVYAFATQNSDGAEGYVLASTDMRIGNLLAVVDGVAFEEQEEWFTNIISEGIAGYIERTLDQYDSITEEEIQQMFENVDLARVVLPPPSSGSGSVAVGGTGRKGLVHYYYPDAPLVGSADWTWTGGYDARVPVQWGQGNPYNYYVSHARNGTMYDYVTGCGPTAIGQIMAHHCWPLKTTLYGTMPNTGLNLNNYTYNWANMRNNFDPISDMDTIKGGAKDIAVLMYEIGHPQRGQATYNKRQGNKDSSTGMTENGAIRAFRMLGYQTPSTFVSHQYGFIEASVALGRPVLVHGSDGANGHVWVVDGVRKMEYTEWYADGSGGYRWYGGWEFVHCNVGWDEWCDAWYINGIFDFRGKNESLIRNATEGLFQYNIKILPDVRPSY